MNSTVNTLPDGRSPGAWRMLGRQSQGRSPGGVEARGALHKRRVSKAKRVLRRVLCFKTPVAASRLPHGHGHRNHPARWLGGDSCQASLRGISLQDSKGVSVPIPADHQLEGLTDFRRAGEGFGSIKLRSWQPDEARQDSSRYKRERCPWPVAEVVERLSGTMPSIGRSDLYRQIETMGRARL